MNLRDFYLVEGLNSHKHTSRQKMFLHWLLYIIVEYTSELQRSEISVLGHYHQFSVTNTYNVLHFIDKDINITKSSVWKMLENASRVCIAESQRIFMAKDCREWLCPTQCLCNVIVYFLFVVVFVCTFLPCHAHIGIT